MKLGYCSLPNKIKNSSPKLKWFSIVFLKYKGAIKDSESSIKTCWAIKGQAIKNTTQKPSFRPHHFINKTVAFTYPIINRKDNLIWDSKETTPLIRKWLIDWSKTPFSKKEIMLFANLTGQQ